jgi:hypothetical protein
LLRSIVICAAAAGVCFASEAAFSADMAVKAPPAAGCVQAVDGVNGKISGFGGSLDNKTYAGFDGSIAAPLGCQYGAQLDLTGADFDGRFLGTVAGHVFWRNPAQGLLGAYGDYTQWDEFGGVRAGHVGPEAEWYNGRWTLQGVGGAEFGNSVTGTINGITQTFNVRTRFFDEVNLAYYPQDDLEVYAGHRYLGGRNALALGGEVGFPMNHGVMGALFAEGRVGEDNYHGVWGGVRFYFGQKDKTLIRRHREDDPTNWSNGADSVFNNGSQTTGLSCPPGTHLVGGVCQGN